MRRIKAKKITESVVKLCIKANYELTNDVLNALKKGYRYETAELGLAKKVLKYLIKNAEIAKKEKLPICQDTGICVFFLRMGQNVVVTGGKLEDAINEGVKIGYKDGYLRSSVVRHPLIRENTGNNTPAVIHTEVVPGDRLKITLLIKGAGSENMSFVRMLKPSDGLIGVKKFILEVIERAGPNPCPPLIVGVGIGGTMEKAAIMAKKALTRPIGKANSSKEIASLERELLNEINQTGIGPEGLGGKITALAVNMELYPTHIASLPVAVNLGCWVHRVREVSL